MYYSGGLGNDGDIALLEICPSRFQVIQKLQHRDQEGKVNVIILWDFLSDIKYCSEGDWVPMPMSKDKSH